MNQVIGEADQAIKAGDWDTAMQRLEELKQSQPALPEVYERLAHVQAVRGRYRSVIDTFLELVGVLVKSENLERADNILAQILALRPDSGEARERRIEIESQRGNMEQAVKLSRELARLCIEQGDGERSIRLLQSALRHQPDNLSIKQELAEILVAHGLIADGASQFRRVAAAFVEQGDLTRAAEAYRRLKVVQSDDLEVLLTLGRLYLKLGRMEEAETELRSVLRHNLEHEEALLELGLVCQLTGRFRSGMLAFNKVLQNNPDQPLARRKLGELNLSLGMGTEALEQLLLAAQAYLGLEQVDDAAECFELALGVDPEQPVARQGLAGLSRPVEGKAFTPPSLPGPGNQEREARVEDAPLPPRPEPVAAQPASCPVDTPVEVTAELATTGGARKIRRGLVQGDLGDKNRGWKRSLRPERPIREGLLGKPLGGETRADKPTLPERKPLDARPRPEPISVASDAADLDNDAPSLEILPFEASLLFGSETEVTAGAPDDSRERDAVATLFDFEPGQVEEDAVATLFDFEPDQVEEEAGGTLFDFEPDQVEEDTVGTLFDFEPDQVEEDTVGTLFDFEPDQAEEDAVGTLFDFEPDQAEEDTAATLFDFEPAAAEEEAAGTLFDFVPTEEDAVARLFDDEPTDFEEGTAGTPFADEVGEVDCVSALSLLLPLPQEAQDEAAVGALIEPEPTEAPSEGLLELFIPLPDEEPRNVFGLFEPTTQEAAQEAPALVAVEPVAVPEESLLELVGPLPEEPEPREAVVVSIVAPHTQEAGEPTHQQPTPDESEAALVEVGFSQHGPSAEENPALDNLETALSTREPLLGEGERARISQTMDADSLEAALPALDAATRIVAYHQALLDNPDNLVLRARLADLHLKFGLLDEAVEQYRQLVRLCPHEADPLRGVIQAELWSERYDQAADSLVALAELYLDAGQQGEALDALQSALTLDPLHCHALRETVRIFRLLEQPRLAHHHLGRLAETCLSSGDLGQAVAAFRQLLEESDQPEGELLPSDPAGVLGKYLRMLLNSSQLCEAVRALRKLERAGEEGKELKEGVLAVLKVAAESASDPQARFHFGELCQGVGELDRAIEQFQQTRRHPQLEALSYNKLGVCFAAKRGLMMTELAIKQFHKGLASPHLSDREEVQLRLSLATVLAEAGKVADALCELQTCRKLEVDLREVECRIARLEDSLPR